MLQLAWFWKILKGVIALFSSDKPKPKRAAAPPAPPPPTPKKRKFRWLLCFAPSEPGLARSRRRSRPTSLYVRANVLGWHAKYYNQNCAAKAR